MHPDEAHAWSLGVPDSIIRAVRDKAALARGEWAHRMGSAAELRDIAPWALGGWFSPYAALSAAACVAMELAIIVDLWPETPRVLHASWE